MARYDLPAPLQHECDCGAGVGETCITASGNPAREMHASRINQLCRARYIEQWLSNPEQNRRMECANLKGHRGQHRNATGDLFWQPGAEIDLSELIREAENVGYEQAEREFATSERC